MRRNRYPWHATPFTAEMQDAVAKAAQETIRGQWPLTVKKAGSLVTVANDRRHREKWFKIADATEIATYIGNYSAGPEKHIATECRTGDPVEESDFSVWGFPQELNTCTQTYSTFYNHPTRLFFPGEELKPCIICPERALAWLNFASNRWEIQTQPEHPISTVALALDEVAAYDGGNCFPCGMFQLMEEDENCPECTEGFTCLKPKLHPCTGLPWMEEMCNLSPDPIFSGTTVIAFSDLCCHWWIKECCVEGEGCPNCPEECENEYTVTLGTFEADCPMECLNGAVIPMPLNVGCDYVGQICVEACLAPSVAGDPEVGCFDNSNLCECPGPIDVVNAAFPCDTAEPPDCCVPTPQTDPTCLWCQLLPIPSSPPGDRRCIWCKEDCGHGLRNVTARLRCVNNQWLLTVDGGTGGICPYIVWSFTADPRPANGACPPLDGAWTGNYSLLQACYDPSLRCTDMFAGSVTLS